MRFRLFGNGRDRNHHLHVREGLRGLVNWQIVETFNDGTEMVHALSSGPGWHTLEEAAGNAERFLTNIGARFERVKE